MHKCFLAIAAIFLISCGTTKKEEPVAVKSEIKPTKEGEKSVAKFKTTVHAMPSPNRYQVILEWDQGETEPEAWVLHREDTKKGLYHLTTVDRKRRDFIDADVTAGEVYQYYLSTIETSDPSLRRHTSVTIPRDLEINTEVNLREITNINRLFLNRGARITSGGDLLNIFVNEIHSQEGTVETFRYGQTASAGRGRDGGTIVIRARTGTGVLHVVGRGEKGAAGFKGPTGITGTDGDPGAAAELEMKLQRRIPSAELMRVHLEYVEKKYGPESDEWRNYYDCKRHGADGKGGGAGGPGGPGSPGHDGGSSGKIYVEIKNPASLIVQPRLIAGFGGRGGEGGDGGAGGNGGEGGPGDRHRVCKAGNKGPAGPTGSQGVDGGEGSDGNLQVTCMKLGDALVGDCDGFHYPGGRVW